MVVVVILAAGAAVVPLRPLGEDDTGLERDQRETD
jgi:hypothetical protein